jgi:molybdate transport system substrate-binding protein
MMRIAASKIGLMFLLAQGLTANAAEIRVFAGGGIAGALDELAAGYERKTGHILVMQYGLAPQVKRRIEAGEAFDLVILSHGQMDDLTKQGKIIGARIDVGRDGQGVAVRAGAMKPDISSVEAAIRPNPQPGFTSQRCLRVSASPRR